jgi:GTPase
MINFWFNECVDTSVLHEYSPGFSTSFERKFIFPEVQVSNNIIIKFHNPLENKSITFIANRSRNIVALLKIVGHEN